LFGLGRQADANTVLEKAYSEADHGWCADTTREQIKKLDTYLQGFPYRQIVGLTQ
jgi:hypothetical protein